LRKKSLSAGPGLEKMFSLNKEQEGDVVPGSPSPSKKFRNFSREFLDAKEFK
jgi:hypothetical protein